MSAIFDGRDAAVLNCAPSPGIETPFMPGIPLGIRHCGSLFTDTDRVNGCFDPCRRVGVEHLRDSVVGHFASDFFAALNEATSEEESPALLSSGSFCSKEKTSYTVEVKFVEIADAGGRNAERATFVDLLSPFAPGPSASAAGEADLAGLGDASVEIAPHFWNVNSNIQFYKAVQYADVMQSSDEHVDDDRGSYEDGTWSFAGVTSHPVSSAEEFLAQVGEGLQIRALAKSNLPSTVRMLQLLREHFPTVDARGTLLTAVSTLCCR